MTDIGELRIKSPTVEQLDEEIKKRRDLVNQMVGNLYPGIIRGELDELYDMRKRALSGPEYVYVVRADSPGTPIHEDISFRSTENAIRWVRAFASKEFKAQYHSIEVVLPKIFLHDDSDGAIIASWTVAATELRN